jgi:hypothetical protein
VLAGQQVQVGVDLVEEGAVLDGAMVAAACTTTSGRSGSQASVKCARYPLRSVPFLTQ